MAEGIESVPTPILVGSTHEAVGYLYNGTPCPLGNHHVSPVRVTSTAPFTLTSPSIREGATQPCPCAALNQHDPRLSPDHVREEKADD